MELRVEGNEIRVKGDKRLHAEAHRRPAKYGTEDDRTPWEYSANVIFRSMSPLSISSLFFSAFVNQILFALDAGRAKGEGPINLVTRGEFVNLIREKVMKEVVDLYNQAYFQVEANYIIKRKPRIEPEPDNELVVVLGTYGSDSQTFVGEVLHKNGENPHLLPPNRFPHVIDDTIEYLTGFHDRGEGPVHFHNRLAGDPNNVQRGLLFERIIRLFNEARYLTDHSPAVALTPPELK